MSVNSAHTPGGGVLIHAGESIILFCKNVTVDFDDVRDCKEMHGDKKGCLYLTTHRMIFTNDKRGDAFISFSFPFVTLKAVELEQPVFGANYIKGKVRAQPGGGFSGEARFKLTFKHGGCIEFGQAMLQAAKLAGRHAAEGAAPPPYTPYQGNVYPAPPPAYTPSPQGYYGWVPPYQTFPDQPPAGSVYVQEAPPPYPGLGGYPSPPQANGAAGPSAPGGPPIGFYTPGGGPGPAYAPPPPQPGYGQYPGQAPQYPGQAPQYPGQALQYPGQTPQYPGQAPQYPGQAPQYPAGYPQQQQQPNQGYWQPPYNEAPPEYKKNN